MPRYDGTGPQGHGSRTGGGFGRCMPDAISTPLYGVGRGFAHGGGRGRCRMTPRVGFAPAPPYDDAQERELLRQEAQQLQAQLDRINARLSDLTRQTDASE